MDPGWLIFGGAFLLAIGWITGTLVERQSWVTRAMPDGQTPHHCDGRFYFVIEEGYFCREFRRRAVVPPRGGSGTVPPQHTMGKPNEQSQTGS